MFSRQLQLERLAGCTGSENRSADVGHFPHHFLRRSQCTPLTGRNILIGCLDYTEFRHREVQNDRQRKKDSTTIHSPLFELDNSLSIVVYARVPRARFPIEMNETTDLCSTLPLTLVVILEHFILLSKRAMDPMLDEDSLDDDDDDEPTVVKRMTGKVTEKNPNYEKKKRCNCKKGCSKRSCSCFKFGSGCNATCGCGPSCANMFKHLDYFFGENQTCNPHTCFITVAREACEGRQRIEIHRS